MMARPPAIAWFERLYLLSVVISVIGLIGTWDVVMNTEGDDGVAIAEIGMVAIAIMYVATFLIWFFIMRRRSNIARWLLTILTILAAPLSILNPDNRPLDIWYWLELGNLVIGVAAVVLLFTRGGRKWFGGTPDNLAETFS